MKLAREMHSLAIVNTCDSRMRAFKQLLDHISEKAELGEFGMIRVEDNEMDTIAMMSLARGAGFNVEWLGNRKILISW